ncbi:hypothetical protein NLO98_17395 [Pseudomonas syringae]|nr:hypothetical protein [Pseudomonas syringae]
MGASTAIVSSHCLSNEEFYDFVDCLGGVVTSPFRATIIDRESNIWIALLNAEAVSDFYEDGVFAEWEHLLGGEVVRLIEMQLDHSANSQLLAFKIAVKFGRRWPLVFCDVDGIDLQYHQIVEVYNALLGGKGSGF